MVPDDVVEAFVFILHNSLRNFRSEFKWLSMINRLMVLAISKIPDSEDLVNKFLAPVLDEYTIVDVVLMSIILHKHYQPFIFDIEK